jgi:hypothetical protein
VAGGGFQCRVRLLRGQREMDGLQGSVVFGGGERSTQRRSEVVRGGMLAQSTGEAPLSEESRGKTTLHVVSLLHDVLELLGGASESQPQARQSQKGGLMAV